MSPAIIFVSFPFLTSVVEHIDFEISSSRSKKGPYLRCGISNGCLLKNRSPSLENTSPNLIPPKYAAITKSISNVRKKTASAVGQDHSLDIAAVVVLYVVCVGRSHAKKKALVLLWRTRKF